jgi:SAM-dependent methyltransferase
MTGSSRNDPFSRTEYRRVISWPERVRREAPFFDRVLGSPRAADSRRRCVLDVGCGTGEHTRHFAERGWEAVGIDVAEHMIEDAAVHAGTTEAGGSARFELCEAAEAGSLGEAPFDAAVCLGNMLAFVETRGELDAVFGGIARALAPGGTLVVQLLNYERIVGLPVRALGVNVRPLPEEEGAEIVFVRVLKPAADGTVDFYPITLTLRPDSDPPVEVRSSRRAKHFPWTRADLERALDGAGFDDVQALGSMTGAPYDALESQDLVLTARRRGSAAAVTTPRGG